MVSVWYADLPNVDTFYYIIYIISPPVSSTNQAHGGGCKFSEILIFTLKAENLSFARKFIYNLPDIIDSFHSGFRKSLSDT